MELFKILDNSYIQCYTIQKPSETWNKVFPKKYVYVVYYYTEDTICCFNVDNLFDNEINYSNNGNSFMYIFSKESAAKIKRMFNTMGIKDSNRKYDVNRTCGFNPGNPNALSKNKDVILNIMSLNKEEYSPTYVTDYVYSLGEYNNVKESLKNNNFLKIVDKTMDDYYKDIMKNAKTKDPFVNFILHLKENFPLNHGGTIRRFYKKINAASFKNKSIHNNYYIGFDLRSQTIEEENNFIKLMENITNYYDDYIPITETYNNSIKDIMNICDKEKISYKKFNKKIILIKNKDYNKLSSKLISTISDYV